MAPTVGVLNYNVACIRCGNLFPVHIATEDLFRTGTVMACCNRCLIECKAEYDNWHDTQIGHCDDPDLEKIDDRYASDLEKLRGKGFPKYPEVK